MTKCRVAESNHGHEDFQSSALPTELTRHHLLIGNLILQPALSVKTLFFSLVAPPLLSQKL